MEGTNSCPGRESYYAPLAHLTPTGLGHFIHRLSIYLSSVLRQTQSPDSLLFQSANSAELFDHDLAIKAVAENRTAGLTRESPTSGVYLSPMQEDYFLNLFWDTYQKCWMPLLNEAEFKEYY